MPPFEVRSEDLYLPYHSKALPLSISIFALCRRERTAPKPNRVTCAIGIRFHQRTTHLVLAFVCVDGIRKFRVWESEDRCFDHRCLGHFKRAQLLRVRRRMFLGLSLPQQLVEWCGHACKAGYEAPVYVEQAEK